MSSAKLATTLSARNVLIFEWCTGREEWTIADIAKAFDMTQGASRFVVDVLISFRLVERVGLRSKPGCKGEHVYKVTGVQITPSMLSKTVREIARSSWEPLWSALRCGRQVKWRGKPRIKHVLSRDEPEAA